MSLFKILFTKKEKDCCKITFEEVQNVCCEKTNACCDEEFKKEEIVPCCNK